MQKLAALALGIVLPLFALMLPAAAQNLPAGFTVPALTLSPDHRYGVTVAQRAQVDSIPDTAQNQVVDMQSGKIIGSIKANLGFDELNFNQVKAARWSADDSYLLWHVDGKWCPVALVLLGVKNDAIAWQVDLLKTAQQAILTRTKKAKPQAYAAAMQANAGNGDYFPDGFTVDVISAGKPGDPLTVPLKIQANLTANPKADDDTKELASHLEAQVDQNGKFTVTKFSLISQAQWNKLEQDASSPSP